MIDPLTAYRVVHCGPAPSSTGGMETVMATLVEFNVGCGTAECWATWKRAQPWQVARLFGSAAVRLARVSAQSLLIHVHLSERGSFLREGALAVIAQRRDIPVVATIHGAHFVDFAKRHPRLTRHVLNACDVITCLSVEAQNAVREVAGKEAELVPNPVPPAPSSTAAGDCDEIVLFAGEVGKRKGADVLAASWRKIRSARPKARCLVVGPEVRGFVMPSLDGMTVMGEQSNAEVRGLMGRSRVVVLPSRAEGMPMVLTEAIAARRPFVASDVGGITELSTTTASVVPPDDPEAFANAVIRFLADPGFATEVGDRGWELWRKTRSPDAVGRRLGRLYENAVGRREQATG